MQTETTRILDEHSINYLVKQHRHPAYTCEVAAEERGVRLSQIVKCMVAESDGGQLVALLLPGDRTLKSSKARKWLKASSLTLVPPETLAERLGLTVGAISPLQLMGQTIIIMDPTVLEEEKVDISSGHPLAGVELSSKDLAHILNATLLDIISTRNN